MYDTCFCFIRPKEDIPWEEDSVLHPVSQHPCCLQYDFVHRTASISIWRFYCMYFTYVPSSRNGRDRASCCAYPHINYTAPMTSVLLYVGGQGGFVQWLAVLGWNGPSDFKFNGWFNVVTFPNVCIPPHLSPFQMAIIPPVKRTWFGASAAMQW